VKEAFETIHELLISKLSISYLRECIFATLFQFQMRV